MARVGIVVPTIAGREDRLEATLAAYEATCPEGWTFDITIPEGYATVGEAWNAGAEDVEGDYLHFGIDDAEPHPGWAEAAATAHSLPAARIVQPTGEVEACGSMGGGMHLPECESGTPCRTTGLPFVTRRCWESVGSFLPIHYYVEDDWYWRAAKLGYRIAVARDYCFTHYHKPERGVVGRAMLDMQSFLLAAAGNPTRTAA